MLLPWSWFPAWMRELLAWALSEGGPDREPTSTVT